MQSLDQSALTPEAWPNNNDVYIGPAFFCIIVLQKLSWGSTLFQEVFKSAYRQFHSFEKSHLTKKKMKNLVMSFSNFLVLQTP